MCPDRLFDLLEEVEEVRMLDGHSEGTPVIFDVAESEEFNELLERLKVTDNDELLSAALSWALASAREGFVKGYRIAKEGVKVS